VKQIRMGPDNMERLLGSPNVYAPDIWVIEDRAGERRIEGQLVGMGSSQRENHSHDPGSGLANARCTACRWSEIYIFQVQPGSPGVPPGAVYCVYTLGPSILPGEFTRANVRWGTSGFEVVELATVRRGERGGPFLPAAHSRALAMAASVDDDIADAYVNRAVA
jgi:hypothetical protein